MLRDTLTKDRAETIALQALAFLASEPDEIARFLAASGLEIADLRDKAGDPDLLSAVLAFILADDTRITGLCQDLDLTARDLHAAHHILGQP